MLASLSSCRDLSTPALPGGTRSPETYHSREGGLMLAESALRQFRTVWTNLVIQSGILTDEFTSIFYGRQPSVFNIVDQRVVPEASVARPLSTSVSGDTYVLLHELRGQARLARGVLATYAPEVSLGVRARLYAFEAYAELWLADMFCSGVPLSTLDFGGDYTYRSPSSTEEVYTHAVALFDSALTLAADSAAVQTFARVGKGRALLALGQYDEAEAAVTTVQGGETYRVRVSFGLNRDATQSYFQYITVSDEEGTNGLPFRSNQDPRTASPLTRLYTGGRDSADFYLPSKYSPSDSIWVSMASGIEAQLIKAEATLHRGEWTAWLSMLNTLRTTGAYTQIDTIYTDETHTTIARIDTLWQAGTGGVEGLGRLQDPGTERARIKLHFAERAAWLFASAQRQGDLRRLVRVYGWPSEEVYPIGAFTVGSLTGEYGQHIDLPIPSTERRNPYFRGCLKRD